MEEQAVTGLSTSLHFSPLLSEGWLYLIAILGIVALALSVAVYRRGLFVRSAAFLVFLLALLNPSLVQEERSYVRDVATIVVDRSGSQMIGERTARTDRALEHLTKRIDALDSFDLRVIEAPSERGLSNRTDLFTTLDQSLADVPQGRRAGVIFLTDGQIHDAPDNESLYEVYGPVHQLLSGEQDEKDRQIVLTQAPAYGLVGKNVRIKYRVEDTQNIRQGYANVTLTLHTGRQTTFRIPPGREQTVEVTLDHAGDNVFSLQVDPVEGELTTENNTAVVLINGVRDRLKVLLVSGIPHSGERTWRDLLTSDPSVDLVHFTILREPQKFDLTPKNELSLIAFPFNELFELKLNDFDLIIFDRYRVNNILPDRYFRNIARYVQNGGAFLEASGPAFAGRRSVYDTPLGEILPARPTGNIVEQPFKPTLTELGSQHPVTESLIWNNSTAQLGDDAPWGRWLRYIDVDVNRGEELLQAVNQRPLLVLDRVGQGRVAQMSSDHIWLWSRGYDGGGPHAELLRRIVHWLMKEPELDERAIDINVYKNRITVSKRAYDKDEEVIALTRPNGEPETITLKRNERGLLFHEMTVDRPGIYIFEDTNRTRKFAIVGDINASERHEIKTTEDVLKPLVEATDGATIWLERSPEPDVLQAGFGGNFGGSGWLALRQNNDFSVTGVRDIPLLPNWLTLFALLCALVFVWWREGQNKA